MTTNLVFKLCGFTGDKHVFFTYNKLLTLLKIVTIWNGDVLTNCPDYILIDSLYQNQKNGKLMF